MFRTHLRLISIFVMVAFAFCGWSSAATIYKGECINEKGKFKGCKVEFTDNNSLKMTYKGKKEQTLNKEIKGDSITGLTGGEWAKRHVGASVALAAIVAPVFLFMLFAKKKRDQFGVEYVNENGGKVSTLFQVDKKYGVGVTSGLKSLTGLEIDFGPEGYKYSKSQKKKMEQAESLPETQTSKKSESINK